MRVQDEVPLRLGDVLDEIPPGADTRPVATAVFLPGVIMPASLRYAALFGELASTDVRLLTKELEVYAGDEPPPGFSVEKEVEGLRRFLDERAVDRVALYGHSGGGAVALAFVAAYPERVASLAIDEPATDFTDEDRADPNWQQIEAAQALPPAEAIAAFLHAQLAPGIPLPPPPAGPPPPWMAKRPRGIGAFASAVRAHRVPLDRYHAYPGPVLYTHGSLSNARWERMRERLGQAFMHYRAECFEGLHHLNTSHQAEPARVADLLRALWAD